MKRTKRNLLIWPLDTLEMALACLLIVCRALVLVLHWNSGSGFDWGAHVEMIKSVTMGELFTLPLFTHFYDYHPPLSFLVAKAFAVIGIPPVAAVQLASASAGLAAFLFFRGALRRFGILKRPAGVVFLYVTSVLPMTVYLSYSVNIDVFILAFASAALYFTALFIARGKRGVLLPLSGLGLSLAFALYTKTTGILLFPLPFLCILLFSSPARRNVNLVRAFITCLCALILFLGYGYQRYYRDTGSFFPSNTDHFDRNQQAGARAARDRNPLQFIAGIFKPSPSVTNLQNRDLGFPRLADTWKDLWVRDGYIISRDQRGELAAGRALSFLYARLMPFLVFGGALLLITRKQQKTWTSMGYMLFWYSVLLVAAIICYIYRNPWAGSLANKGIYIVPVTWFIGFLLAQYWTGVKDDPKKNAYFIGIPLGIVILLHHLLPVY